MTDVKGAGIGNDTWQGSRAGETTDVVDLKTLHDTCQECGPMPWAGRIAHTNNEIARTQTMKLHWLDI